MKRCSIGLCLDKKKLSALEFGIEKFTGDAHHAFIVTDNTPGEEMIIESHIHTGVIQNLLADYKDYMVLMLEPTFLTKKICPSLQAHSSPDAHCRLPWIQRGLEWQ